MSEEIKEILDKPKILMLSYGNYISLDDYAKLKDYITNLQEDNQRLKEIVENLTTMTVCGDRKQIKNTAQYKLEQAQSRIDKAIEYLKYGVEPEEMEDYIYENLIEILKGG